jgi:queuosine precursor transporter
VSQVFRPSTPLPFIFISLLSVIACFVLLYLGQYAQLGPPPQQLRLEVIIFLGILFATFIAPFWPSEDSFIVILVSLIACALLSYGLSQWSVVSPTTQMSLHGSMTYLLSPIVALLFAFTTQSVFKERASLYLAISSYVICTVLANYTLDSFIPVPLNIPALNFTGQINVGTLFFGMIFTQRDHIHQFGRNYAYLAIALAVVANVIAAWYLQTPWRFIAVSFLALSLSELTDTEIYQRFIKRNWWTRVATSNAISIPVDSIVFTVLAFWNEDFSWMVQVIITDIVVKLLIGFIVAMGIGRKEEGGRRKEKGFTS